MIFLKSGLKKICKFIYDRTRFPFRDLTLVYAYIQFLFYPAYHQNLYFGDPRLFVKVTQDPNKVLRKFNIIELYELWFRKIEELFGAQNQELYVGESSDFVYREQLARLEAILKIDKTKISKDPFWVEKALIKN